MDLGQRCLSTVDTLTKTLYLLMRKLSERYPYPLVRIGGPRFLRSFVGIEVDPYRRSPDAHYGMVRKTLCKTNIYTGDYKDIPPVYVNVAYRSLETFSFVYSSYVSGTDPKSPKSEIVPTVERQGVGQSTWYRYENSKEVGVQV